MVVGGLYDYSNFYNRAGEGSGFGFSGSGIGSDCYDLSVILS